MKIPRGILNNLISTVGGTLLKIEVSSSNIGIFFATLKFEKKDSFLVFKFFNSI